MDTTQTPSPETHRCEHDNVERSMPYLGYNRCHRDATRQVGRPGHATRWLCTFHANRWDREEAEREARYQEWKATR
jgi:hypothetical protein